MSRASAFGRPIEGMELTRLPLIELVFLLVLGSTGQEPEPVIEGRLVSGWVVLLREGTPQGRKNAAWALRQDGLLPKSATTALAAALSDPDTYVREEAAKTLAAQGPPEEVVPQLRKALVPMGPEDMDELGGCAPCYDAAMALVRLGPKAVPTLLDALADQDTSRGAIIYALGQIGPAAAAAIPLLQKLARDGDGRDREEALDALRRISGKRAKDTPR